MSDSTGSIYYQDDFVTLYLGDCMTQTAWLDADVLCTDPPYGIKWSGVANYTRGTRTDRRTRGNEQPIAGDSDMSSRDGVLAMWGNRPAIVFGVWSRPRPDHVRHRLIWWKRGQAPGPACAPFMAQDEEIYILGDGWIKTSPPMRTVIETRESRSLEVQQIGHPTPKPLGLMQMLIERAPDGVIADPFAGSGSTLVAAKLLGRKAVGVELEEKYCEIAARRLSQGVLDFGDWKGNA